MAASDPPIWSPALHKEALDLLVGVWPETTAAQRELIVDSILVGPPLPHPAPEDQDERERRQRWFDRRIFDRLALLERMGEPILPHQGAQKLEALRLTYPQWKIAEGEQAHFSSWMESGSGLETDRSPRELEDLSGNDLINALRAPGDEREGRLMAWGQVVSTRPGRGIGLLYALGNDPQVGDGAIWRDTLNGLRDSMARATVARRVLRALIDAPDNVIRADDLLWTTSDTIEIVSKRSPLPMAQEDVLRLWDRVFDAALAADGDPPDNDDWVGRAINRPVGRLASALLNLTFKDGLKAGAAFPEKFRSRLTRLTQRRPLGLRYARTILASRLLYLFAIDPDWTVNNLLPFFDWQQSEDDAASVWSGYGWTPRINVDLWLALSPFFYDIFDEPRLQRLDHARGTVSQLLMAAGVDFSETDVPTEKSRRAIKGMNSSDREAAVAWLANYLAGPELSDKAPPAGSEAPRRADLVWRDKIAPWLRRVWPRDGALVEPVTAEKFARLAVATQATFPDAVSTLLPYMVATENWGYVVHSLAQTRHPDDQPVATLKLLSKIVRLGGPLFTHDLRGVLDRIAEVDPALRASPAFRSLDEPLRASGR